MQKPLKVIGIDQRPNKYIVMALITLYLFGLSVNGLFELWKLWPTVLCFSFAPPDWENLFLFGSPTILFTAWVFFLIYMHKRQTLCEEADTITQSYVPPHKGIVLALSKPSQQTPADICKRISDTAAEQLQSLYDIKSIGQSFKALYYHRESLRHVWLVTTKTNDQEKSSESYIVCIEAFLEKFITKASIRMEINTLITTEDDALVIEKTKQILCQIYEREYLNDLDLKSSDVIVDITGGTRTMGVGMTFGALDSSINIQYVEQRSRENNIIPLLITPMSIMDKTTEYLRELYMEAFRRKQG